MTRETELASLSPTVARWELACRLRARREELGLEVATVVDRLGFSRNYWWAVENDKTILSAQKLDDAIDIFGIDAVQAAELRELRAAAKRRPWWAAYTAELTEPMLRLIGLESGAEQIWAYEGLVVTGLLQVPDYARALIESNPESSPIAVGALLEVRLRRQARLREPDPPRLTVVLGEAALRQNVGGPGVMRAQMEHLVAMIETRPDTLELRVRPFSAPAGGETALSLIYLMAFASPYLPLTGWLEGSSTVGVSDPKELRQLELSFEHALATSLDREASRRAIEQRIAELS